jgi:hypothetical protein
MSSTSDRLDQGAGAQITIEQWTVPRSHRPKLGASHALTLPLDEPEGEPEGCSSTSIKKPIILKATGNGSLLRVGSKVFIRNVGEDPPYRLFDFAIASMSFIEEMACTNTHFAITTRKLCSKEVPQKEEATTSKAKATVEKEDSQKASPVHNLDHDSDSDSDSDSSSDESTDESVSETRSDPKSTPAQQKKALSISGSNKSAARSTDSLSIKSDMEDLIDPYLRDFDDSDGNTIESNSARESWSEASTAPLEDEIEDEMIWNDFASDDDVNFEDVATIDDEDSTKELDVVSAKASDEEGRSLLRSLNFISGSDDSRESTGTETESSFSGDSNPSWVSSAENGSDNGSQGDGGRDLDELLGSGTQRDGKGPISEIRIFKFRSQESEPAQVFRFTCRSAGQLYDSPPVFHPTQNLVVWPLGANELLFADFVSNTFFSRILRNGLPSSCSISVQCRFSACGQYLHMASVDGFVVTDEDGDKALALRLHISTYRLSKRKTTRSPPKLVYRTSINLNRSFSEEDKLSVDNLPFTLTWTREHIYVAESRRELRVYRIPLYQEVEDRDRSDDAPKAVFTNSGDVFLPESALMRKVYFFPTLGQNASEPKSKKSKGKSGSKEAYAATVLIGAQNLTSRPFIMGDSLGAQTVERTPPQGLHLTAAQLGRWETAEGHEGGIRMLKKAETWRGGQLLAKFEKFDRSEDCDIVPYLH